MPLSSKNEYFHYFGQDPTSSDVISYYRGGEGVRNVRYLEWQILVQRKFGTSSEIPLQNLVPNSQTAAQEQANAVTVGFWMPAFISWRLLDACCYFLMVRVVGQGHGQGGGKIAVWGGRIQLRKIAEKLRKNCGKLRKNCGKIAMS